MPTTYKIISNFEEVGTCEGIPDSDSQGNFIFFPTEMHLACLGDLLEFPNSQCYELYLEDAVINEGKLIGYKMYYR